MATPKKSTLTPVAPMTWNYKSGQPLPESFRDAIDAHLAIEQEDAKSAGSLGYMARAFVTATMPYKDPKADSFTRINGNFRLRIVAGYEGGIPYGIYPRLLMSWIATEAVRGQTPVIELGESLSMFLRDVMGLRGRGGGSRGSGTRVVEQMRRLFGAMITADMAGDATRRGVSMRNVMIADDLQIAAEDVRNFDNDSFLDPDISAEYDEQGQLLWTPQAREDAGTWKSKVRLSHNFFKECIERPVPIDLRAYKALREAPLAMDIYTWLTYRMSYTQKRTRPIPWPSLMMQFGSNFNTSDVNQNVRNFKAAFLKNLQLVLTVYPDARLAVDTLGLVLMPSRPHVAPLHLPTSNRQSNLF